MFKPTKSELFLVTLIGILVLNNLNYRQLAIASNSSLSDRVGNFSAVDNELIITKKSGGRSGGGSFKSRPSRSKRSSPSRNSSPRQSSSPSRRNYKSSPTYRNRDRLLRNSSPTYYRNSSRGRRGNSPLGFLLSSIFLLIFFGGLIFVVWLIFKQFSSSSNSTNRAERKIIKERDNDRVTISVLQVALSSVALELQSDLSELSINANTDSASGLAELMRESALILLRNDNCWTHVRSSSQSLDINRAESAFDRISVTERSKFSNESLSNVDGQITTKQARNSDSDGFPAYVVVTLICGTADDNPLFEKIYSETDLREVLLKLSAMREDYLMKFELLWTPQTANEYLSDEELLMEYTDIMPL